MRGRVYSLSCMSDRGKLGGGGGGRSKGGKSARDYRAQERCKVGGVFPARSDGGGCGDCMADGGGGGGGGHGGRGVTAERRRNSAGVRRDTR